MKNSLNEPMFSNLMVIVKVILILPHSSASVEREFSQLTLNKTKIRSRLNIDTISAILLIKDSLRLQWGNQKWEPSKKLVNCISNSSGTWVLVFYLSIFRKIYLHICFCLVFLWVNVYLYYSRLVIFKTLFWIFAPFTYQYIFSRNQYIGNTDFSTSRFWLPSNPDCSMQTGITVTF